MNALVSSELVTIVSADDVQTGTMDKYLAHRHPVQRHRAISVWLQNSQGEVLMQQRSARKIVGAGWWANTVCGNVWDGETYLECAVRRLSAELGIVVAPEDLVSGKKFEYKAFCNEEYGEHEVDQIFCIQRASVTPLPNPEEVAEYAWVPLQELQEVCRTAAAAANYYTAETACAASWDELAAQMRPLSVATSAGTFLLAPWTVFMIIDSLVSLE